MKVSVSQTRLVGPPVPQEQFIPEHLFFYLEKGVMSGYYGHKTYTLSSGEYGIARKNRLSKQQDIPYDGDIEKIIFVFDEAFLKAFQKKHRSEAVRFNATESFVRIDDRSLVPAFIQSLKPYYNEKGQIDQEFFDIKREELLLILLRLQPTLAGIFFDYAVPEKIDLEAFMNMNYRFNVSVERFAFLTGRSLSAFKRDFHLIFGQTPSRWLVQKRLQEAYFLIEKKQQKPTDIFLDLGFETLSHFSFAFKKQFGQTPTALARQSKIPPASIE
ncbi:helix-turn-helix domain-containing protein [Chitinophaga pinensis]|uniref:Transcriptional regulator, AraC family n=1 Tax=Chitinophaga pinensis (strain ATCC 43595 / DSM 2588 / LMG 13176 / NBRC 15968 / NCIMB 11800 / UQM 2034) TaxID=485918 RepID=A0A979G4M3_CHIPD|nr:AraC family transcriptional regulator [Chitinophaga pinensis]ACU60608.1 transcriptional regulator, AraC family [Chitinophaga pinensis DSM 2588]